MAQRRRKKGDRWGVKPTKRTPLPRGVTVRGRCLAGGVVSYRVRFRSGGSSAERKLAATTDREALAEAAQLALEVARHQDAADAEAADAADELLVELHRFAAHGGALSAWLPRAREALVALIDRADRADAEDVVSLAIERKVAERLAAAAAEDAPAQALTWAEATARYLEDRAAAGLRERTIETYKRSLAWAGAAGGEPKLATLTTPAIGAFCERLLAAYKASDLAQRTYFQRRAEALTFLRWARSAKLLPASVTKGDLADAFEHVAVKKPKPKPNPLAAGAEVRSAIEAAQRRDEHHPDRAPIEPFLAFLMLTGARLNEARLATWDEFTADCSVWTLAAERTKTDAARVVTLDLTPSLIPMLQRRRLAAGGKGYVFPEHASVTREATSKRIGQLRAFGAPERLSPQILRQTAACALVCWNSHAGLAVAAARLGHGGPAQWSSYIALGKVQRANEGETLEAVLGIADLVTMPADDAGVVGARAAS